MKVSNSPANLQSKRETKLRRRTQNSSLNPLIRLHHTQPYMGFPPQLKYLIPKGVWLKRTLILLGFNLLDLIVTAVLCRSPSMEANPYARSFMEIYGIIPGLTIFNLIATIPIYAVLIFDSYMIEYTRHYRDKVEVIIDLAFGWLIAGSRFNGAMSWLWNTSHLTRQALGFIIYLSLMNFKALK